MITSFGNRFFYLLYSFALIFSIAERIFAIKEEISGIKPLFSAEIKEVKTERRKIFMKRNIKTFLCVTAAAAFICFSVISAVCAGNSFSWYCKRCKDHVRPTAESNMAFIEKYDGAYIGKDPDDKVVYLTFDAGYENGNVERILDALSKHNAKGAFFILDNLAKRNGELVKRMESDGHFVCNHTARHKDMTKLSKEEFASELEKLESTVSEQTGVTVKKYYRPPEGRFSEENLKWAQELGYKTVLWSLAYADWDNNRQPEPEKAKKLILDNVHNGAVILLHPTSKTNADILDDLLTTLENDGYRFGTLDELFSLGETDR